MREKRERLHGRSPKIVFRPLSYYLAAVAWPVKSFDRKRLTSQKQSVPPKHVVHFIFGLKYICYKDQLGYLIIERWSNKLMVNTAFIIIIIITIIILLAFFFTVNFTGYSGLLGEETSRNHQAYKQRPPRHHNIIRNKGCEEVRLN